MRPRIRLRGTWGVTSHTRMEQVGSAAEDGRLAESGWRTYQL